MNTTELLISVFVIAAIIQGCLAKLANEETIPKESAEASMWLSNPDELTLKGQKYRKAFIAILCVNFIVFVSWLYVK